MPNCLLLRRPKGSRTTIFVPNQEQPQMYGRSPNASEGIGAISNEIYGEVNPHGHQVQFLSAEDEYAMMNENPPAPLKRESYEGAIRYASLLWDRSSKPTQSMDKDEKLNPKTPIPPRSDNMRIPLIG